MLLTISLARSLAFSLSRALFLALSRGEREGSSDEANLQQDHHGGKQYARNPLHAQHVLQHCHKSCM